MELAEGRHLRDLDLRDAYRSDQVSLARDFYIPCLSRSTSYWRAAGYFTSSSLSVTATGLYSFVPTGGRMRLVVSPYLSSEDAEAIASGYDDREEILARSLASALDPTEMPDPVRQRLELLAWLIAEGRLDIKVALVVRDHSAGLYHEKFGIFEDADGDFVAFAGSANESAGGLVTNFEAIDVFRSWIEGDRRRAASKRENFERLWDGNTSALTVHPFPDAAREQLLKLSSEGVRPQPPPEEAGFYGPSPRARPSVLGPPPGIEPRSYQLEAVESWLTAGGRGIWEMATGTGKTITALTALSELSERAQEREAPLFVVIVCPLKHLVRQWRDDVIAFGVNPVLCFDSHTKWTAELSALLAELKAHARPIGVAITTNRTFCAESFQSQIRASPGAFALVADEVHNFGSTSMLEALPEPAQYRLGLSATPERQGDEEGTAGIADFFGETVFSLPLADAIEKGILSPYRYFPIVVTLTDEETEDYVALTVRIGQLLARDDDKADTFDDPDLKQLLLRRARLIAGARNKLAALLKTIEPLNDTQHNLIYCSDAKTLQADDEDEVLTRQLDAAVRLLGRQAKMRVHRYTHEESPAERERLMSEFSSGSLQALVAIRCLDEGVDIPAAHQGFILASSSNPRQFIQRRGRLLRRAPGKRRADIYDYLAVPPPGALDERTFAIERRLVSRELQRVVEFAQTAENGPEAMGSLRSLRERYHLLDNG